jgi:antitoxin ParD1/3/4
MPMIKKSITVTDKQNEWLQAQIELGLYASDSELLRDLIRQKQENDANNLRVQAIRAALIEGERSGLSKRTPNQIKQAVLERQSRND